MYRPSNVPADVKELSAFLQQELLNLQKEWATPQDVMLLKVLHAPPPRTLEGMVVLADGADWNPGSGQGMYRFQGSWKFVG